LQKVKHELSQVFTDKLARNAVTFLSEPKVIEGAAKETPPAKAETEGGTAAEETIAPRSAAAQHVSSGGRGR